MSEKLTAEAIGEMRKSARKILLSHAIFVSQSIRLKSVVTIDVSSGGLSLIVPDLLHLGNSCAISFDVPGESSMHRALIQGTVASCIAVENGYRIGVQYVESDSVSRQLIQAAVEHYLEQGHS